MTLLGSAGAGGSGGLRGGWKEGEGWTEGRFHRGGVRQRDSLGHLRVIWVIKCGYLWGDRKSVAACCSVYLQGFSGDFIFSPCSRPCRLTAMHRFSCSLIEALQFLVSRMHYCCFFSLAASLDLEQTLPNSFVPTGECSGPSP